MWEYFKSAIDKAWLMGLPILIFAILLAVFGIYANSRIDYEKENEELKAELRIKQAIINQCKEDYELLRRDRSGQ